MEAQIESAVEIAWNPASDPSLKEQAFDFLNSLRADSSAWHICLGVATASPKRSEVVRHVSLEIVVDAVSGGRLDAQSLEYTKNNLLEYLRREHGTPAGSDTKLDSPNIQNKFTQLGTWLFVSLYRQGWESFFDDILSLTGSEGGSTGGNASGVVFYLKTLNAIHDEIADVLLTHTPEEQKRNGELKDLVRQRDVQKLASSWQEILSYWKDRNDTILEICLKVVGRWVSWVDISLIVNDSMLSSLFNLVGRVNSQTLDGNEDRVRNYAIEAFTEIVAKKMKPSAKLDLIIYLNVANMVGQLSASPPLGALRSSPKYDVDLAEYVAKLINMSAGDIIRILDNDSVDGNTRNLAVEQLQLFLPHILRFFADEYDEICSDIIPCLVDLLSFFRKEAKANGSLSPFFRSMLSPILEAIIAKMKYDETSDWSNEDEKTDEAEFQDLRKRLHVLQQTVSVIDENLFTTRVSELVASTFQELERTGGQTDWRALDLALHEMYLFGEMAIRSGGGIFIKQQPASGPAERLIEMLRSMIESEIASYSHPAIQLLYMEICVRYCSFFEVQTHYIPRILEHFVRFVHHNNSRVRLRAWYLFQRFVKHLRAMLGDISQDVIEAIRDLLPINAEVPREDGDMDNSSDENDSVDAIFTSQLYLFEAIGCISSTSTVPVEKQVLLTRTILEPLLSDMERWIGQAKSGNERATLQVHHDMMAIGTLARGFSDWNPSGQNQASTPPYEVASFERVAEVTLVSLKSLKESSHIRFAARFAFSRLMGVLGARILPQLPQWIDGLLSQNSTKDEMATFVRLLQQIVFGFKSEIYSILDTLLTPLLQRLFTSLGETTSGTDDELQLADLRKEYLNLLLVILNNDLGAVLVSEANQNVFDTLIGTIEHFAKDTGDYPTSRVAFSVFIKMAALWGGPDVVDTGDTNSASKKTTATSNGTADQRPSTSAPVLPGFDRFMMERFTATSWQLPLNPSFAVKDAQARQVLHEIAALQRTIYTKTGGNYSTWLREVCLPGLSMAPDLANEFICALESLDARTWRQFYVSFVQRSRT